MGKRKVGGDPRRAGGDIAGPGGPFEQGGVVIDATDAVMLDSMTAAAILAQRGGEVDERATATLLLEGRINKTDERSKVLYLMSLETAAALCAELAALISRLPDERDRNAFLISLDEAMAKLPKGNRVYEED